MLRLLQIEFIKLKNSRASKVLIATYFILLTSIALIVTIKFNFGKSNFHFKELGIFNFPYIWHFNTYLAAWFKLFLLLVIVSMTANEYSNRTLKQNLIDGLSKKEFILSKFYMVVVFSLISTIFVFVTSLILGLIYSDFNELSIIFSDLEYLLAFFVKLTAFFSFGLFLGILIKRSAFAVGAMGVWFILEVILTNLLRWNFFRGTDVYHQVMQFFPMYSIYNLIEDPFTRMKEVKAVASQIGEVFNIDYAIHWNEIAIPTVWTFLFIFFSYRLLLKRDL
jgi:ABC-type transport system involved in multi-copper enzyme maturation permease subunit